LLLLDYIDCDENVAVFAIFNKFDRRYGVVKCCEHAHEVLFFDYASLNRSVSFDMLCI
jgi:hypothetical protein